MPGGLARAQAWIATHRKPLLVAGAAGAVALGLYSARNRGDAGAEDDIQGGTPAQGTYGVRQPADDATGGAAYDSTGNDVYNALQPQLEENQRLIDKLLETVQNIPKSIPVTGVPRTTTKPRGKPKKGGTRPKKKPPRGRARGRAARNRQPAGKQGGHRHPKPAPHKQGRAVTHPKAGGRPVVHPQPVHRQTTPHRVTLGTPATRRTVTPRRRS